MRRILLLAALMMLGSAARPTMWYVDRNKSGDGTSIADAFAKIESFTEAARTGGTDSCVVCRTHVETLSSLIDFTSDGTADAPIVIFADDGTYWPDSTGTPTITCNDYYMQLIADENWHIIGLEFTSINVTGVFIGKGARVQLTNCIFSDFAAAADIGVNANYCGTVILRGCEFGGGGQGAGIVSGYGPTIYAETCTFNDLTYGANLSSSNMVTFVNCEFGQVAPNITADIRANDYATGPILVYGGVLDDNDGLYFLPFTPYTQQACYISRFYVDAQKRPMVFVNAMQHKAISDYAVARSGGADYSIALTTPMADIPGKWSTSRVSSFSVYADSAETRTYSLYAYRDANWGSAPAANELYIEVQYQFADTIRSEVSTQTLTNAETWYALSVADVSPQHDGPVLITLWLGDYDANGKIHVDPRLVATGESYHETSWWPDMLSYFYQAPAAGGVPWKQIF